MREAYALCWLGSTLEPTEALFPLVRDRGRSQLVRLDVHVVDNLIPKRQGA